MAGAISPALNSIGSSPEWQRDTPCHGSGTRVRFRLLRQTGAQPPRSAWVRIRRRRASLVRPLHPQQADTRSSLVERQQRGNTGRLTWLTSRPRKGGIERFGAHDANGRTRCGVHSPGILQRRNTSITPPIRAAPATASPFPVSDRRGRCAPADLCGSQRGLKIGEIAPVGCAGHPPAGQPSDRAASSSARIGPRECASAFIKRPSGRASCSRTA